MTFPYSKFGPETYNKNSLHQPGASDRHLEVPKMTWGPNMKKEAYVHAKTLVEL